MRNFEKRIQLPHVLDDIHRQAIANKMASLGIDVGGASWQEINEADEAYYEDEYENSLFAVTYEGKHTFGPLLGRRHHLLMSDQRDYETHTSDTTHKLSDDMWSREIHISDGHQLSEPSRIYLVPDSPPFAIHGEDYAYVNTLLFDPTALPLSSTEITNKIQELFGPDNIELISEELAGQIIDALLSDASQIYEPK